MKKVILALEERHLIKELKQQENMQVLKVVPFSEGILKSVMEAKPDCVVWSPTLQGDLNPSQVLFQLTTLDEPPKVVFLAGNLDKKDELVGEAVSSGVYDIVFNPPTSKDVLSEMVEAIIDRIHHPRNRARILNELGVNTQKQIPKMRVDSIKEVAQKASIAPVDGVFFDDESSEQSDEIPEHTPPEPSRPYIVGVLSPASAGATFISTNLAATMALNGLTTALIDFCDKRSLHVWLGRDQDPENSSFQNLFEHDDIVNEQTEITKLTAYTSKKSSDRFLGDVGYLKVIETLPDEVVVLDFSSGNAWRKDLLYKATEICDEVLFVMDMDFCKSLQSRPMLEDLSNLTTPVRIVMNKWNPRFLPCDISGLTPKPPDYKIPCIENVYESIVTGVPLVSWNTKLREDLFLKSFRTMR